MLEVILPIIVLIILVVQVFRQNYVLSEEERKLPPAKFRLPFLGNLHQVRLPVHSSFMKFSKTLGPIMTVWLGKQPVFVVSDIVLAKELLLKHSSLLLGRPQRYIGGLYSHGFKGLILGAYGKEFKEANLMIHSAIRWFLNTQSSFERVVAEECLNMQKELEMRMNSEPIDIRDIISCGLSNVMTGLLSGEKYRPEDDEFQKMRSSHAAIMRAIQLTPFFERFVFLRYLPLEVMKKFKDAISWRNESLTRKIDEHMATYDGSNIRDIIDYIIAFQQEKKSKEGESHTPMSKDEILILLSDLYVAGTDTTTTAIEWSILYMTVYPEVQKKVQAELDRVLGDRTFASLSDKPLLPYTEATIHETLRKSSVTPLGVPRVSHDTISINGYSIKPGSIFMFNHYSMHHDPKYWVDPDCFQPERFLDESGKFTAENKSFIPFSFGMRACTGKKMAKAGMFLFFTYLLKCFEFRKSSEETVYTLEGNATATLRPKPFAVRISRRS